jgi:hypothetical protein
VDAAFSVAGIIEEFEALVSGGDFEGAEELLAQSMGASPQLEAFFHFQYGRLYSRWNKLTSALNHLLKAAELSKLRGDELFTIQVVSELKSVKEKQAAQKP